MTASDLSSRAAERIVELRAGGLSQQQIARSTGLSQPTISRILRGRNVQPARLERVCALQPPATSGEPSLSALALEIVGARSPLAAISNTDLRRLAAGYLRLAHNITPHQEA